MTPLIEQIKKAGELNRTEILKAFWDDVQEKRGTFVDAGDRVLKIVEAQHAQMIWAVKALEIAVEALKCNEIFHDLGGIDDCEPCKAKRKIAALVPKGDHETNQR